MINSYVIFGVTGEFEKSENDIFRLVWEFPCSSLNPHISRMAWLIPVIHTLFFSILETLSNETNFACSSPLIERSRKMMSSVFVKVTLMPCLHCFESSTLQVFVCKLVWVTKSFVLEVFEIFLKLDFCDIVTHAMKLFMQTLSLTFAVSLTFALCPLPFPVSERSCSKRWIGCKWIKNTHWWNHSWPWCFVKHQQIKRSEESENFQF